MIILKNNQAPEEQFVSLLNDTNGTKLSDAERQLCEVYTRVMGYIRPKTEFNLGKQAECAERKYYKLIE